MDREELKDLLELYRPEDAGDPMFAEALAEVARDAELAAWFARAQRFDAAMRETLRELPVPPEVRREILQTERPRKLVPFAPRLPAWAWSLSAAAVLVLAAVLGRTALEPKSGTQALAMQAIQFTDRMPALQFVCFDSDEVASWVNHQPAVQQAKLTLPRPGRSADMVMIGSSVVNWQGRPVVMICLQNGGRMAMLYMLKADDLKSLADGASETMERGGWFVRTSRRGDQLRVLTSKGSAVDANFPVPF